MKIGEEIMTYRENTYGQAIISGYDTDFEIVQNKINARKRRPTEDQIEYTKRFLKQFKINVHIPEFNTVAEMELWRKEQIKLKFGV